MREVRMIGRFDKVVKPDNMDVTIGISGQSAALCPKAL